MIALIDIGSVVVGVSASLATVAGAWMILKGKKVENEVSLEETTQGGTKWLVIELRQEAQQSREDARQARQDLNGVRSEFDTYRKETDAKFEQFRAELKEMHRENSNLKAEVAAMKAKEGGRLDVTIRQALKDGDASDVLGEL